MVTGPCRGVQVSDSTQAVVGSNPGSFDFSLFSSVPFTTRPLLLPKPHFIAWRPSFSGVGVDLIAIFLSATDKVAPRFEPSTAEWEARTLPLCQAFPLFFGNRLRFLSSSLVSC